VGDVGTRSQPSRPGDVLGERERAVDGVRPEPGVHPLPRDEAVDPLGRGAGAPADLAGGRDEEGRPRRLEEPWASTTRSGANARAERRNSAISARVPGERSECRQVRVLAGSTRSTYVAPSTSGENGASTAHRDLHVGPVLLQRPGQRHREDDVSEGRKPDQQNFHAGFAILTP